MATAIAVPNSAGTAPPKLQAPPGAADCHIHIFDPRFSPAAAKPAHATVDDYRLLQKRLGISRVVIVTPRLYGTQNDVTVDAIAHLGADRARGIGVLRPDVTDGELKRLNECGIRGLRFTVGNPATAVVSVDMIEPLAKRVADLGWHVQLHMEGEQIVELRGILQRLPCPIVFDHLGRLPPALGVKHPAFGIVRDLLDRGRAWLKMSGAYLNTAIGPPTYADATAVAREYVKAAPERLVWGSDWPHTSPKEHPDSAVLFDLLLEWAPDPRVRERILVDNPESLYGFRASSRTSS
jgi:D-galactarolactone isomerase